MNEVFVTSAQDIRRSLETFNRQAERNHLRGRKLLAGTTYWVYDPDSENFGPAKFVGLINVKFSTYEHQRHEVSGGQTREAIERALDDVFEPRPPWSARLLAWGTALLGDGAFGKADAGKWRFTSLRPKDGRRARVLVEDDDSQEFPEGELSYAQHRRRERSAALVRTKKRQAMARFGKLECEACGFDFRARYGEVGAGYIECHHTIAVAELTPKSTTHLGDVVLVCSNCHRMLHRKRPWLSVSEVRVLCNQQLEHNL
jgi:5-methylcytosine-specific restriction protein A